MEVFFQVVEKKVTYLNFFVRPIFRKKERQKANQQKRPSSTFNFSSKQVTGSYTQLLVTFLVRARPYTVSQNLSRGVQRGQVVSSLKVALPNNFLQMLIVILTCQLPCNLYILGIKVYTTPAIVIQGVLRLFFQIWLSEKKKYVSQFYLKVVLKPF